MTNATATSKRVRKTKTLPAQSFASARVQKPSKKTGERSAMPVPVAKLDKMQLMKAASKLLTIKNDSAHKKALDLLESLESKNIKGVNAFAEALASAIETYEEKHHEPSAGNPADMLRFLMEQHELKQSDLSDVAPQSRISEVLSGKREFTVAQARALGRRFGLQPALFLDI